MCYDLHLLQQSLLVAHNQFLINHEATRSSNHLQMVCGFSACLQTVLATSVSLTLESSCSSVSFEQSGSLSLMQTHGIKQIPKWWIRVT